MHYPHGRKEQPAACRLEKTPGECDLGGGSRGGGAEGVAPRAMAALRPAEMLPKTSSMLGAPSCTPAPFCKALGRGSAAAGCGGLALRAPRVTGTPRSRKGVGKAPSRPCYELMDHFGGLSGAGIIDEASLPAFPGLAVAAGAPAPAPSALHVPHESTD